MLWTLIGIIIGTAILAWTLFSKNKLCSIGEISRKYYITVMAILFGVFTFLLFYRVDEIPIPWHVDEAGMIYDAKSIIKYHCDRFLYRFPVHFINFGGGQNALYTYLAAITIKLFGYSKLTVRIPAIILSLLSVPVFVQPIRKEKGRLASIIAITAFCFLPYSIMHSRWALESYLLFPMMVFSNGMFYHAVKEEKTIWFIFSGILYGITLYTYAISYLIIPPLLAFLIIYLLWIRKIKWKHVLAMGIPLFFLALPLILFLAVNNGLIDEIKTRFFSIPKLFEYRGGMISLENIVNNLSFTNKNFFYRTFVDDKAIFGVIPKFGTMYYFTLPLLFFGLFISFRICTISFRNREFSLDLLMICSFFITLFMLLLVREASINRVCALFIPLIYFLAIAVFEIIKRNKYNIFILISVFLLSFGSFIHYYFTDFSKDLLTNSMIGPYDDLEQALNFAETVYKNNGEMTYILDGVQPYIYTLLILDVDPYTFNERKITYTYDNWVKIYDRYRFELDKIMPECIYIFRESYRIPEDIDKYGFEKAEFGTVTVYYPPS